MYSYSTNQVYDSFINSKSYLNTFYSFLTKPFSMLVLEGIKLTFDLHLDLEEEWNGERHSNADMFLVMEKRVRFDFHIRFIQPLTSIL